MKNLILILTLLTLPGVLWAKDVTADKLETNCKAWTTWDAAGRPAPKVLNQDTAKAAIEQNRCLAYMVGWTAGVEGALAPDDKGVMGVATFADGITAEQMAKVFVLYMAAHPEEENKPAHLALSDSMFNAGLLTWPALKAGQ